MTSPHDDFDTGNDFDASVLPSDCAAFRERAIAGDVDVVADSHVARCSNPVCRAAADDATLLNRVLSEWTADDAVSLPSSRVDAIVDTLRPASRKTVVPQGRTDRRSYWTGRIAATAALALLLCLIGVITTGGDAAPANPQIADTTSKPDTPDAADSFDGTNRPRVAEVAEQSVIAADQIATPPIRLSTRGAEQWVAGQVESIVSLPVRMTERDLWRDLTQRVPAEWTPRFPREIRWPELPSPPTETEDQTLAPGVVERAVV